MKKTVQKRKKMTKKRPSEIAGVFSLFQGIPVFLKILFLGSKPNFLNPRITTTTCKRGTYNDFHPQTNKKSKPNPNPIQTQFARIQKLISWRKPFQEPTPLTITDGKCPLDTKPNFRQSRQSLWPRRKELIP
ncbi:MAG TPA: hypothetical protein ENH94_06150 [Phycisphaerales bacterium]|nr:hypothetical protein [Phycisphaerales bacterium]